jgi:hypothetical protein
LNSSIPLGEIDVMQIHPCPPFTQGNMLKMKAMEVQPVHLFIKFS